MGTAFQCIPMLREVPWPQSSPPLLLRCAHPPPAKACANGSASSTLSPHGETILRCLCGLWVEGSRLHVAWPCVGLSLRHQKRAEGGLQGRRSCAAPREHVQDGEGHVPKRPEKPTLVGLSCGFLNCLVIALAVSGCPRKDHPSWF